MKRRTNIIKNILFNFLRIAFPVILTLLLLVNINDKKVLSFNNYKNTVEHTTDVFVEQFNRDTVVINSYNVLDIPDDINNLIKSNEKTYSVENKKGNIIESDYHLKNATSEYNNIYFHNATKSKSIDISRLLDKNIKLNVNKKEPSVLIYHTHVNDTYEILAKGYYTTERNNRSNNHNENMVRIGKEISDVIRKNGFNVIHDTTSYDESYNGAYDRARENISKILRDNPSIQIVLDIQRGMIYKKDGTKIKPTGTVNNHKVSQMTIICGCEEGNIKEFPNWEKNLAFGLKLQKHLTEKEPSIVCPLYLCARKYNMDLMPTALQIEIGTDANTILESVYAARKLGETISEILMENV